jgi:hypothetical protein
MLHLRPLPLLSIGSIALWIAAALPAADDPQASFSLSEAKARPGETAVLILSVNTSVALEAISIALDFDESKVRVLEVMRVELTNDGTVEPSNSFGDLATTTVNNADVLAGDQSSEGWIHIGLKVPTGTAAGLPVKTGSDIPIVAIKFLVLPAAPAGFTPVTFSIVGPWSEFPSTYLINEVEFIDRAGPPVALASTDLRSGGIDIDIIGEVGFFMRGDSNFDQTRDISDPIMTLAGLFVGGVSLPCKDAADANDDGRLDVSDPIFSLGILFQGSGAFPAPAVWGKDPTPDDLGCSYYPGF